MKKACKDRQEGIRDRVLREIEDFPVRECNPCGVRCGNVCHDTDERQSDDRGLSVETFKPLCILGAGTDGAGKGSERKEQELGIQVDTEQTDFTVSP